MCVAASYGFVDPYKLVEWLEWQKLLGVHKVFVYSHSLHVNSTQVLKHYTLEGFVSLRYTKPFTHLALTEFYDTMLQMTPIINDCMYRNLYMYRKIFIVDFDEYIIPHVHVNYSDMLLALDEDTGRNVKSYIFRNAYFLLEMPQEGDDSSGLVTLQHRTRTAVSPGLHAAKSMIDTRQCVIMHNHICLMYVKHHAHSPVIVNQSVAMSHHYKRCHFRTAHQCEEALQNYQWDNSVLRFKNTIVERVQNRLLAVNMKFPFSHP